MRDPYLLRSFVKMVKRHELSGVESFAFPDIREEKKRKRIRRQKGFLDMLFEC